MTALDNAIRVAGSANKLASTLGVSGMAVSQWKTKGIVPSSRVLQVFNATGVTPHELRLIYIRIQRMEYLRSDHANHLF